MATRHRERERNKEGRERENGRWMLKAEAKEERKWKRKRSKERGRIEPSDLFWLRVAVFAAALKQNNHEFCLFFCNKLTVYKKAKLDVSVSGTTSVNLFEYPV